MSASMTVHKPIARRVNLLQQERRRLESTVKEIVLRGLRAVEAPAKDPPFVMRTFDGGFAPNINPYKLNELLDNMEIADFLEKFGR